MAFRAWQEGEDYIAWCMELVNYVMEQHGQNPNLQTPTEFEYYVARHGKHSDYQNRTHEQLVFDVNELHRFTRQLVTEKNQIQDSTRKLAKEKNQMQSALGTAERKVDAANLKIWILAGALCGEGAVIGWVLHELLLRFH